VRWFRESEIRVLYCFICVALWPAHVKNTRSTGTKSLKWKHDIGLLSKAIFRQSFSASPQISFVFVYSAFLPLDVLREDIKLTAERKGVSSVRCRRLRLPIPRYSLDWHSRKHQMYIDIGSCISLRWFFPFWGCFHVFTSSCVFVRGHCV